ncbi:MAG: 4Fe-4S binding protein [Saprospiraceae bacterium]
MSGIRTSVGGGKGCFWGCLGFGDCAVVCDFDAITMNSHGLPVVDVDKCTACGDCVEACPKGLFSLQPISNRLWVNCKNLEQGDDILEECLVACTACGKCAMDSEGVITMVHNLPVVDYNKNHRTMNPIQRCLTGAIVWLDDNEGILKGKEAREIVRKGSRGKGIRRDWIGCVFQNSSPLPIASIHHLLLCYKLARLHIRYYLCTMQVNTTIIISIIISSSLGGL